MDPDALLQEIRDLNKQVISGENKRWAERQLRWKFNELDVWLSRSGFLPKAWEEAYLTRLLNR